MIRRRACVYRCDADVAAQERAVHHASRTSHTANKRVRVIMSRLIHTPAIACRDLNGQSMDWQQPRFKGGRKGVARSDRRWGKRG